MSDETSIVRPIDEAARRRFERAWREGEPQSIEDVLPPTEDPRYAGTLEELVHVELELSWKAVRRSVEKAAAAPRVETYVERFSMLRDRAILLRLLQTEYAARRRYGDRPDAEEYRGRFPDLIVTGEELRPAAEVFSSLSQASVGADAPLPGADAIPPRVAGYEITGRLGEGGMGVVWSALQLGTRRTVALKLLTAADAGSPSARARFAREVELAARLEHPHIASVFDTGVHEGAYFYAMELVDGVPLDAFIDQRDLSRRRIVELVEAIAAAVQHAHQKGVIHRDLKPSNILVTKDGEPRVLDFGLAKALLAGADPSDATVTIDGEVAGTPAYMSPEQAAGRMDEVDTRTDVYSLGVILYRALTGRSPHDLSGSHLQVMRRITDLEPPRPRQLDPTLDADLEAIVLKAMAKDPDERYPSAAELAADLKRYLTARPVSARPATATYLLSRWLRRNRWPATAAAATFTVLVSMATYSYFRIGKERDEARTNFNEADKQRKIAVSARQDSENARQAAVASEHAALRQLAEGRLSEGAAKAAAGNWRDVKEAFRLSRDAYLRLGVSPFQAEIAMSQALWHSPPAVQVIGPPRNVLFYKVAVSADGRRAVTAGYSTPEVPEPIRVWDLTRVEQVGKVSAPMYVDGLALTPDGRYVLASGPASSLVLVIEVDTDKVLRALRGHEGPVSAVVVSSDGALALTGSDDKTAKLWDVATGACRLTLTGHTRRVIAVALCAARGRALTGSDDGTVRMWDLSTGDCLQTVTMGGISNVALSPDGSRAAVVCDTPDETAGRGSVHVWETGGGSSNGRADVSVFGHRDGATDVAFSPDGRLLLTTGLDDTARLWDLARGQELHCFTGHQNSPRSALFLPPDNGRLALTAGDDGTLRLWDTRAAESELVTIRREAPAGPGALHVVRLSPDGRILLSGGLATPARLFDTATGLPLSPDLGGMIRAASFAPDGKSLLLVPSSNAGLVELWDVARLSRIRTFGGDGGGAAINAVSYSPDGRQFLTRGEDGAVRLWNHEGGQELHLYTHDDPASALAFSVNSVSFSKDGKLVLSAGGNVAKVWDLAQRRFVCTIGGGALIRGATFSPDSRYVLTAGGGERHNYVTLWDARTGASVRTFRGHSWRVTSAGFSPDGVLAYSTSEDNTTRVWEVETGREVQVLGGHNSWVSSYSLSADGNLLVTAGWDGTAQVWDFNRPMRYRDLEPRASTARERIEASPADAVSLAVAGEWYAFRGLDELAIGFFERARAAGAKVSPLTLARCFWRVGNTERAHAEFGRAVEQEEGPKDYLDLCLRAASGTPSQQGHAVGAK